MVRAAALARRRPHPHSGSVDETPAAEHGTPPDTGERFVRTYRWMDTFGSPRALDIYAEEATRDARVWVYLGDGDTRRLVAMITPEGRFLRHSELGRECGLDTAAAWNDLIEICRHAHIAYNY